MPTRFVTIDRDTPVILPPDKEDEWPEPNAEPTHLLALLKPYDSAEMEFYPVSRAVNLPSHNAADCIVPIWPLPTTEPTWFKNQFDALRS